MEDVLSVYSRPYDEKKPVVCMDEKPVQFFADFRKGFRSRKNGVQYEDYQYIRNGTACIFLFTEPLTGLKDLKSIILRNTAVGSILLKLNFPPWAVSALQIAEFPTWKSYAICSSRGQSVVMLLRKVLTGILRQKMQELSSNTCIRR